VSSVLDVRADGRPNPATAIGALRDRTATAHRRLEDSTDLMSPSLGLDRYRSLLLGFAAVHRGLEDEIGRQFAREPQISPITTLHFDGRRRLPLLADDLAQLGAALPEPTTFKLTSVAGALGALYVCEGSTLGGSVVAPHIRDVLGVDAPIGFFTASATEVPLRWMTCRRVINEMIDTPASLTEATAVALAVFEHFAEVLQ
jgi:heme oxygenase